MAQQPTITYHLDVHYIRGMIGQPGYRLCWLNNDNTIFQPADAPLFPSENEAIAYTIAQLA